MTKLIEKNITASICLGLFLSLFFITNSFARTDPRTLKFPAIEFQPDFTERVVLKNGIILHLLENHELPLINIQARFRAGSIYEPQNKSGLASLTGSLMRTGGTETMSGDEMNEELEFIAGSVEVGIGREEGSASLSVLNKDLVQGLNIFADVLMKPVFPEEKVELQKNRVIESIRRENDSPSHIASRELKKILYEGSPYGSFPTIESVRGIKREDLVQYHKTYFGPNNLMLGITGDFDKAEMIDLIRDVFKGWKKRDIEFTDVPKVKEKSETAVHLIKKELSQSVIRMGHIGIKKTNPDYHAVRVMGYILGSGGFNSRLMKEIRSDRGLAYSVWSYFVAGYREVGPFLIGCGTKVESTAEAISLIIEITNQMRTSLVSYEELVTAKKSISNSFVFAFTTSEQVVGNRMNVEFHKLSKDYLETYREKIDTVTREDVLRVAKKYLHPDKMTILVVGDEKKFDRSLSEFGAVIERKVD